MALLVPMSWGELIDKITILEIKDARIADPGKRVNVLRELEALRKARDSQPMPAQGAAGTLAGLTVELRAANEALWELEDAVRDCESNGEFSQRFVSLARSVYLTNDKRAGLKRRINELLGSELVEEKSYKR